MMKQSRRSSQRKPTLMNRAQLTGEPQRRRAPKAEPESEWTISSMSAGTPILDQVESEQDEEEEGSAVDRVIRSTILLASCLDLPLAEYIPLLGILPAAIGTVLDGLDKNATYDELGDPGVGQALTTIRTAVEFAHVPMENLSLAPTALAMGLSGIALVDPSGTAAVAAASTDQAVAVFDAADLIFASIGGGLETAQFAWDAYQSARLAAEGQSELAEAYGHLALDDGIDVLNSVLLVANRIAGLCDVTGAGGAITFVRLVASNMAFSDDNTQSLHDNIVGPNYTVEPRTARGWNAWGDTYEDQRAWVDDTRGVESSEEEEEQETSPGPDFATSVRDGITGARASAKERWEAFVAALDMGGTSAAMEPMDMAKLLTVVERPMEALLQQGLATAAQSTELLESLLLSQQERIEQINDGYGHLDTMLGEVESLLEDRDELKEALGVLGLPTAPLDVIDGHVGFLQERIATERAILDAAFGEAGVMETALQAAYDAVVVQVGELQNALEQLSTMPFDVATTVAWLQEVAIAMANED